MPTEKLDKFHSGFKLQGMNARKGSEATFGDKHCLTSHDVYLPG